MTDYRRFLQQASETMVLPYLGGPYVDAPDRRLRAVGPTATGWWRFEVSGRTATAVEPADPPDLGDLPAVRGYWVAGYLVGDRAVAYRLAMGPGARASGASAIVAEPMRFAPVIARRWHGGALLYDSEDFETGVEDKVRAVFEQSTEHGANGALAAISGVPAPLRAAFGYAVMLRVATALAVPVRPVQLRWHIGELVAMGDAAARRILTGAQERRAAEPNHVERWRAERTDARLRPASARERTLDRAEAALYSAGALLRDSRWLSGDLLEVRYDFMDDRFVSVVDGETLRVVDAGICLAGADERLTLESLPGVIAEAIRTYQLEITAW
ncbi:hypothetical protein [Virgisporangium ochraceum]|uniref:Uncharacterized protein n=1 Tax=Virgisporangium ochraceum TaxID=65505 RepID=A0A8J4A426_9ACTN|nr:hypothetical protein [Virgisporangium ochraceum]GIJ75319.1 hypothetical protein Voc01_102360 [Virgisporangium ochraceum]